MALTQVTGPYPVFTDLDGTPLDDGYLYIGDINDDPEVNPIQAYWDSNLSITATQPIRTSNGYPYRNGSPAILYTAGDFSITIRNKNQEFVLYSPLNYGFGTVSLSELAGPNGAGLVGKLGGGTVQDNLDHQKINETAGNLVYGSTNSGSLLNNTPAGTKNGDISTAFGIGTIPNATSAYALAAFGYNALNAVTTGHSNTGLGYQAGSALTTGIMNTLVGVDAMFLATTANFNTVVGHHCMNNGIFSGQGAVVIGQQTARNFTSGDNMIWIGRNAGANSPATGSLSCEVLGAGAAIAASVANSTVIGKDAVAVTAAISNSVIIGKFAQYGGGTIASNVLVGVESFFRGTGGGGNNNTGLGFQVGYQVEGVNNTLVGYRAGYMVSNTSVNSTVCIGHLAGFNQLNTGDLYIGNSDSLASHLIWGNFAQQILKLRSNSLRLIDLPTFADNAAAVAGGLVAGTVYKTATGELRIVV